MEEEKDTQNPAEEPEATGQNPESAPEDIAAPEEEEDVTDTAPAASSEDESVGATDTSKLQRRSSKLRRALLKKITPIAYRDTFKSKDLATSYFLGPILDQKVDRFAALLERLMPKERVKNK